VNTHKPADNVAVITVSYNSSAQLESFLSSAVKSVSDSSHIFVTDNASSDISATRKLCSTFRVNLVELEKNLGYGGAVNAVVSGLPQKFDVLLIANPDTSLNAQAVTLLAKNALSHHVGAVGPRILNDDGTVYPSARAIPSIRNGIGHAFFANIWTSNPWTKKYLSEAHLQDATCETGWVSGACLAISRKTFEDFSGFDDGYFMYFEDVDLGYRLGKAGFTNLYVPEVHVEHIGGESTKATKTSMLKTHHDSAMRFLSVKYKGVMWAPVRGVLKTGLAVRFKIQARKATT
jgi:N-acetylglucosaminyl-diphospho-decaprenol L-rhamnosyltransferase